MEELQRESPFSEPEKERIHAHLDRLLASEAFAGSRRRQAFLRYVVEESLAGRGPSIKETSIAVDVFGRSRDFDTQDSSVVRVTGGEVRKRLAQAYSSGLGQDLRIELTPGGYHPTFYFTNPLAEAPGPEAIPEPVVIETAGKPLRRRPSFAMAGGTIAACLLVIGASAQMLGMFKTPAPLDQMWRPWLAKDRPVLMSIVTPTLLKVNPLHQDKWLPLDGDKAIPAADLVVLKDSYVGTGGAMGAARFAEQLTSHQQKFDLKFGSNVNFSDLKNSPSILIGVSVLTQQLTRGARYQLEMVPEGIRIVDSRQKERVWARPRRNYASPPRLDGYSLITRLVHSDSGRPLLVVVGMDSHNTEAAVEFLTKSDSFRQFADSAPRDWASKNLQIVLHNSIYGNSAGSNAIVASEVW
jgi:hypothetical protein